MASRVVCQLACAVCFILLYFCTATGAKDRPNILVLMVDDLGFGDLGCYGNRTLSTPQMDRLAAQGVRFTQALAAGATCTPSRAAFLTARYPIRSGLAAQPGGREVILFTAQRSGLPRNEVSLARVLVRHGYATSYIGKWHLGVSCEHYGDNCHTPNAHGFQYWYGMPMTNLKDFGEDGASVVRSYLPRLHGWLYALIGGACLAVPLLRRHRLWLLLALVTALAAALVLLFFNSWTILNSQLMRDGVVVEQPIRLVGLTQRFVAESKERMSAAVQQRTPFFVMHAFSKVHTHLATVRDFRGRSQHGLYGDSVLELDWAVGELLAHLDRLGVADNTLVYLTSDNGGHLEETGGRGDPQGGSNHPLRGGKLMGGMEGGIRVPTLLRFPPLTGAGGRTVDAPVSLMDLYPTALAAAGLDAVEAVGGRVLDGRDLTPLLRSQTQTSPHQFLFHYCGVDIHAMRWMESASVTWKVHFFWPRWLPGTERCQFACLCGHSDRLAQPRIYNIQQDISEQRPLSPTDAEYKRVLSRCEEAEREHSASVAPVPNQLSWWNMMWRPSLQPCCELPYCTCTDPKYPGPF